MHHSSCCCSSSSSCGCGSSVGNGGFGYIEHTVSKFDTLAGVAIKYGVEVADIKRMNSLTTDLQMFALKSLQIPLPGRHPPSPIMSNGYDTQRPETTPNNRRYSDSFSSIKSLKLSSSPQRNISPSINSLRDFYGLTPTDKNGSEMTQIPNTLLGLQRKSKTVANGFPKTSDMDNILVANGKSPSSDKSIEKVRRRKSEIDLKNHSHENNTAASSAGKPRPTAANRTEAENMFPLGGSRDSLTAEAFTGVRKSSSAPTFQPSDDNNNNGNGNSNVNGNGLSLLSIWPTSVLNLTADLQALSITRPIFDGLPKPGSGRKNKTALD